MSYAVEILGNLPEEATRRCAATLLANTLSDISEQCWCAGWLRDCEYVFYRAMQQGGMKDEDENVSASQATVLKWLSDTCAGWMHWPDGVNAPTYITISDWKPLYAAWEAKR